MRKLLGGMTLAAIVLSLPAVLEAQRRPTTQQRPPAGARHEIGVDVGAAYVIPNADGVDGGIAILTPFDIRLGLVPRSGTLMWEPRVTFNFSSVGGETTYLITPGVNVLVSNTPGGHRRGMYFTGGAGLVLGDFGAESGTAFQINGGVGWRKPSGTAALRYEVGFQWVSESDQLGPFFSDYIAIGGRIGLSLWK